ncbi:MAG: ABC transporter ATP-binding protein/permease [Treponema sp.]|nr:ABC transporter ATP-binding protein/permease [Treponema sp.]
MSKNKKEKIQKPESPLNPYHKEFGLFSNIKYILNAIYKYSKILLMLLPIGFLIYPAQRYLWTFITKFVIDLISNQGQVKELLIIIAIFSFLVLILYLLQTFYYNKQWVQCIAVRMKLVLEKNYKMMTMPFEYTEDPEILDCKQKAENACSGNSSGIEGMENQILAFIQQLGVVIFGLVILGTMNLWIIIALILLALINFFISNQCSKYSKKNIWDPLSLWWRKRWYMNMALADFSFAKDIRMYGLRSWLTNKFQELNKERYAAQQRNNKLWFWRGIISHILWLLSQAGIYAYLIYRVYTKSLTIGNFTLYLTSSATFFECISSMLSILNQMLQRSREVDDFRSFLEIESFDKSEEKTLPDLPLFESYEFEFKGVSFKYPRANKYALKNLNIKIQAGQKLALVGLNGAGKSTFIKLLLRLYQPTEGKIYLNGKDISLYNKESYYRIFAPVFQEVNLFALSLAENISMKKSQDSDYKKAQKSLEEAGLAKKVEVLDRGLETQVLKVIYDEGVDFSGGEKQKLALARALYKDAPVVVLDEPTAALDALAESKLYEDFDKLIGGKTSIYISHRLSSTQFCDKVALFKEGQMVEYGSHKELMAKKGEYANMFHIQAQYYLQEEDSYEK